MSRLLIRWKGADWVLSSHGYIEPPGREATPHVGRLYIDELDEDDIMDIIYESVTYAIEEYAKERANNEPLPEAG